MSLPIIAVAAGFSLVQAVGERMNAQEVSIFAVGIAVSAVVGYLAIRFLLNFLTHHSLRIFAYYRFALAAVVAAALLLKQCLHRSRRLVKWTTTESDATQRLLCWASG